MPSLTDLHCTVQQTVESGRLGQPVFVRYALETADPDETVPARLAAGVTTVSTWLRQPLDRMYAVGSIPAGQVALTLEYRAGATAVVSWARCSVPGGAVDLMLLGNHGALYHETTDAPLDPGSPGEVAGAVRQAVLRALQSGRPEPVR